MAQFNYILGVTGDCSHTSSGAISITPSGGTPPYTIEWVDPPLPPVEYLIIGTSVRTNLGYGTYAIRLNDSSLPVNDSFTVNIPVSSGVTASIVSIFPTTCNTNNGSVSATSTSDYSSTIYNLLDESYSIIQTVTTDEDIAVFEGLSSSTYSIEVVDFGGCTGRTSDFIIEKSNPVDFGFYVVPNSYCSSTSNPLGKLYVTGVTGTAPFKYVWSNGGTGTTITGLTTGVYSLEVTDANNCKKSESVYVGEVEPLGFGYFSAVTPTCFSSDGSLTIYVTGGTAPYYYSASTGNVGISYQQNFTISNIPSGSYQFQVTDAGLCTIAEGTSISSPQSIGSVSITTTNSNCSSSDGSIQISLFQGNPPFTYTLIKPDSSSESLTLNSPIYTFYGLVTGDYTVVVSDDSSCVYSQDVYIIANDLFDVYIASTGTTCGQDNGAIEIFKTSGGTEPFNYFVDGLAVDLDTSQSAVTVTNLSSGNHFISVVDSSGCTKGATVFISQSSTLQFSLYSESCGNGSDGVITAFISSGTPPFTFNWSDNIPGNPQSITVNGLTGGTYSLTISDSVGCYYSQSTEISCLGQKSGYYEFLIGDQEMPITAEVNLGLLQMLNDGFVDLTDGDPNCILNSAEFFAIVNVEPVGLSASTSFYTSKTLVDVPSDNVWIDSITSLLQSVPGVSNVIVDTVNNQITIQKNAANTFLDNQIINFDIAIEYDISC